MYKLIKKKAYMNLSMNTGISFSVSCIWSQFYLKLDLRPDNLIKTWYSDSHKQNMIPRYV